MLGGINIVAFVPTTDFPRAKHFYEQVLGLRFVQDDGFALVFTANGVRVRIVKMKEFKPVQYTTLGWEVADIEKMVPALESKGVKFERYGFFEQDELGIWTTPKGGKVAWFKDPDGNTLSISQPA